MAGIEELVDELERSYQEAQERMSNPAVYNDHREAAAAGRRLKELEGPHRLAREWRQIHDDLEAARGDGVLRELVPELEERSRALEEELRIALAPTDPADSKDVIVEIRQGVGGDEAAIWAGDLYRALTLDGDRRGDARGGGGRGRDRPERAQGRRVPLDRAGRPECQHDGLRRARHAPPDRTGRLDAGREEPAPEPPEGAACATRAAVRAGA